MSPLFSWDVASPIASEALAEVAWSVSSSSVSKPFSVAIDCMSRASCSQARSWPLQPL